MRNTLYACYCTATQYTIRMLWPGPCNTQYTIVYRYKCYGQDYTIHNTHVIYCQACAIHSIRGDTIPTTMSPPFGRHVAWCVLLKILRPPWEAFISQKGINMCSLKWSKAGQEKTWIEGYGVYGICLDPLPLSTRDIL